MPITANAPMAIASQRLRRLRCGDGAAGVSMLVAGVSFLAGVSLFMRLFLPLFECPNRLIGGDWSFQRMGDAAGDRTLQCRAGRIFEEPAFAIRDRGESKRDDDRGGKALSQPAIAGNPMKIEMCGR